MVLSWLNPVLSTAFKSSHLEMKDLGDLPSWHASEQLHKRFQQEWQKTTAPKKLVRILGRLFGGEIATSGVLMLISDLASIFTPLVLLMLFREIEYRKLAVSWGFYMRGVALCFLVFGLQMIQTLASNLYYRRTMQQGLMLRSVLTAQISYKTFRLSPEARKVHDSGKVSILVARDAPAVESSIPHLHLWWSSPVQCIIVAVMLYQIFGWSGVFGIWLLIAFMPVQMFAARRMSGLRKKTSQVSDSRQGLLQEIMHGLKTIKFKAWEAVFERDLERLRGDELGWLWKLHLSRQGVSAWSSAFPLLATTATLAAYVFWAEGRLDGAQAVIALTLFNIIRQPIALAPVAVSTTSEGLAALRRLEEFLNAEELVPTPANETKENMDVAVRLKDVAFSYLNNDANSKKDTNEEFVLRVKQLVVPRGTMVAIVGPNGCGKTTLLHSLIGETFLLAGEVRVANKIALATQTPWLLKESIRENITFGSAFNSERYGEVLRICQLEEDLSRMPQGDETVVDSSSLSGGQKQRIGLARALYSENDLVLLDDPVSALDLRVAEAVAVGISDLSERTRIVVTQHPRILAAADQVLVMNEAGDIVAQGDYSTVSGLVDSVKREVGQRPTSSTPMPSEVKSEEQRRAEPSLDDIRSQGRLSGKIIKSFIKDSGGWWHLALTAVFMVSQQTFRTLFDLYSNYWANDTKKLPDEQYCTLTLVFAVVQGLSFFAGAVLFIRGGLRAGRVYHREAVGGIMHSPMIQAMAMPIGSILNRFTYDQDVIDYSLPESFRAVAAMSINVASVMLVMVIANGWYVIPLGIFCAVVYALINYYRYTSRELARILAMSRGPLQAHLTSCIQGRPIIRAFKREAMMLSGTYANLDFQNSAAYTQIMLPRWLELRIGTLGNVVILVASLGFFFASSPRRAMSAVALVKALTITRVLFWLVRRAADTEVQMISIERMLHYQELPREESNESNEVVVEEERGDDWPREGMVDIEQVSVRYLPECPPAIDGLSLHLGPGSHTVVMGRTGSGKSTLLLALFRLVPLETGKIEIDGVDITTLNRNYLRRRLAIVPQEPFIFSSTIRRNLDPLGEHSDDELWRALQTVTLKPMILELGGLDSTAVKSLSLGQQQLMCLARAILGGSHLMVLDEATSALDTESAKTIHKVLREGLRDRTVMAIAHRREAVEDGDRIIEMDRGRIIPNS